MKLAILVMMLSTSAFAAGDVLCGIDVLKRDNFAPLRGKRIAIITNQTGRDRDGNRTVDLLLAAPDVKVAHLFSPEHGLYGNLDEKVGHGVDAKTHLKVFSLYGETREPSDEMMTGIDALVYDIQDVGARYYTYTATLGLCMQAAAKHHVQMWVLDRPLPITGNIVDGPIADKDKLNFTGFAQIPIAYGLTLGELANFDRGELHTDCDLHVVEMQGWKREMWFDDTGLTWVNPSPNMRNPTQALLYLAVGQIEGTNVSVGRGTDQPFELFGSPWIDGRKLASSLNVAKLPGLRFVPIEFTPTSSKFKDELCHGVYIIVTDRDRDTPVRAGFTIAWQLHKLFGEKFEIDKMLPLLKSDAALAALKSASDPGEILKAWEDDLRAFKKTREKYLLYH